jgi:hypothetical protein
MKFAKVNGQPKWINSSGLWNEIFRTICIADVSTRSDRKIEMATVESLRAQSGIW